jgi:predicted nuclease of predicted toxin-antitoxin system
VKIIIDMNHSPSWVETFNREGWEAKHWAAVGPVSASDAEILEWASTNGFILITHDLDFAAILASQARSTPSVIQLRTPGVLSDTARSAVVATVRRFETELSRGVLLSLDPTRTRVRILPIR